MVQVGLDFNKVEQDEYIMRLDPILMTFECAVAFPTLLASPAFQTAIHILLAKTEQRKIHFLSGCA